MLTPAIVPVVADYFLRKIKTDGNETQSRADLKNILFLYIIISALIIGGVNVQIDRSKTSSSKNLDEQLFIQFLNRIEERVEYDQLGDFSKIIQEYTSIYSKPAFKIAGHDKFYEEFHQTYTDVLTRLLDSQRHKHLDYAKLFSIEDDCNAVYKIYREEKNGEDLYGHLLNCIDKTVHNNILAIRNKLTLVLSAMQDDYRSMRDYLANDARNNNVHKEILNIIKTTRLSQADFDAIMNEQKIKTTNADVLFDFEKKLFKMIEKHEAQCNELEGMINSLKFKSQEGTFIVRGAMIEIYDEKTKPHEVVLTILEPIIFDAVLDNLKSKRQEANYLLLTGENLFLLKIIKFMPSITIIVLTIIRLGWAIIRVGWAIIKKKSLVKVSESVVDDGKGGNGHVGA